MSSATILWLIVASLSYLSDRCESATATFGTNGISGTVTVSNGHIQVNLDFGDFDTYNLPGGSADACFRDGTMKFYLHSNWTHSDNNDKLQTACGYTYTGYRVDPWFGCSSESSNGYCEDSSIDQDSKCVPGGSINWEPNQIYDCTPNTFASNPYTCDFGDWTGKYGTIYFQDNVTEEFSSSFEINSEDMEGTSIVFACSSDTFTPAFCAPFLGASAAADAEQDRSLQGRAPHYATSKRAQFDNDTQITLMNNGTYHIRFDPNSIRMIYILRIVFCV